MDKLPLTSTNRPLLEHQEVLASEMYEHGLNLVNCGMCGSVFLHRTNKDQLTCPYCLYTSDMSDFPDFIYKGMAESLVRSETR